MAAIDRKYMGNNVISVRISLHDCEEILTAIPKFSGSGNKERLVGILSVIWVCRKMAAINRKKE